MSMLSTKKVLTVLVALIAVIGIIAIFRNTRKEKAAAITSPTTAVVTMGEDVFTPSTLRVKAGTTVIFKGLSEDNHRVISGPHPEHNELPDLDSKTNISPNGSYSYRFTKVGTFHYLNELKPDENGTVIVE